jgi:transposase
MKEYKIVGIDLANKVFQIAALNQANKVVFNKKVSRKKFVQTVQQLPPSTIAMEACGSANYWARKFTDMGHTVHLVPAQHVKAFLKGQNKNDARDAVAICEAALRPNVHFVPIKTVEQQDLQMLHRVRQRFVSQRTALANQIRAYLRENGIVVPAKLHNLINALPSILEDAENGLSDSARMLINLLFEELKQGKNRVDEIDKQLKQRITRDEDCQRLLDIPGYGPIVVTALIAAIGNGAQFSSGRGLSACLGLTPRHFGTGGKTTVMDTTNAGNSYLRYLLIHGARTVTTWCKNKDDKLSRWIKKLIARRGKHKAIVALANKCARIAWALLTRKETYNIKQASC